MYQTRYVTNRSINRMGLNINKKIDSTLICDYCIIPEADYILKEDTSFLNESISAGVKC